MSAELANKLERLCCAETEREFFNCVADNLPAIVTALRAAAGVGVAEAAQTALARLRDGIDARLNNYLCGMTPNYDDSITGFNEAWDEVRKSFARALATPTPAADAVRAQASASLANHILDERERAEWFKKELAAANSKISEMEAALRGALPLMFNSPEREAVRRSLSPATGDN